ncbi:hypothetical protein [Streptomyces sp. NPDC049916]|uniref:hypothetical protein n=1 Tax=Streptomyces sp. NPDC049916 TaxID=3155156 RepID=UPI00343FAFCE
MKVHRGTGAVHQHPVGQGSREPNEASRSSGSPRGRQAPPLPVEDDGLTASASSVGGQRASCPAPQEAQILAAALLADPEVHQIGDLLDREEFRSGAELRDDLQVFQDRYDLAVRADDGTVLSQVCPETYGRWGHVCVLTPGHEERMPHWGTTPEGPVAWLDERHCGG